MGARVGALVQGWEGLLRRHLCAYDAQRVRAVRPVGGVSECGGALFVLRIACAAGLRVRVYRLNPVRICAGSSFSRKCSSNGTSTKSSTNPISGNAKLIGSMAYNPSTAT